MILMHGGETTENNSTFIPVVEDESGRHVLDKEHLEDITGIKVRRTRG
jgi:hypothetical protein